MDRNTIITIVILAVLVAFVLVRIFLSNRDKKAKEEALKFLNSLAEKFEEVIIKRLKDIDFKDLDNLADIEKKILDDTINELWIIVQNELTTYATSDSMRELLKIIINKEFLLSFIQQFFNDDKKVQEVYTAKYNDAIVEKIKYSKQLEEETVKQNFEYETEDLSKIPKAPPIEEPEKPINPQLDITDDELVYNKEDDSVEIISEEPDEVGEELQRAIENKED